MPSLTLILSSLLVFLFCTYFVSAATDYKEQLPDEEQNNATTELFNDKSVGKTKIVRDSNGFLGEKHTQIPLINGTNSPNAIIHTKDNTHRKDVTEGISNEIEGE